MDVRCICTQKYLGDDSFRQSELDNDYAAREFMAAMVQ